MEFFLKDGVDLETRRTGIGAGRLSSFCAVAFC